MRKFARKIIAIVFILLIISNVISYASINEMQELQEDINLEENKEETEEEKQKMTLKR